jgi:hypothetical protein
MSPDCFLWQACFYRSAGRWDIGRPRKRWVQRFLESLNGHDSILELAATEEEEEEEENIIERPYTLFNFIRSL